MLMKLLNVCLLVTVPTSWAMMNDTDAMNYLMQYGYAGSHNPDPRIAALMDDDPDIAMEMGLKMFQQRYGLEETGVMDEATSELMSYSRCGMMDIMTMDDIIPMDDSRKRKRRYTVGGNTWPRNLLTYNIYNYPQDGDMTRLQVDSELARAFQVWSDVTPLTFTRLTSGTPDIIIRFALGEHGDGNSFDGPGGVLAHAFLPFSGAAIEGDSHFDEAEVWTLYTSQGTNLFQVAAHEFGHALGLGHSSDSTALMAPFYRGYIPNFSLPTDDIMGIQSLYGPRVDGGGNGGGSVTFPPNMPNFCTDSSVNAITYAQESGRTQLIVFQGSYYASVTSTGIQMGCPKSVSADWQGFNGTTVDAALYLGANRYYNTPAYTLLFSGDYYYVYSDSRRLVGNRRPISELGLPGNIDAIFEFARNGKIYAMKGSQYYRLTRRYSGNTLMTMDAYYPRASSIWNLPFDRVDAAIKSLDNHNFFFHEDSFYHYNGAEFQVSSGYPRDTRTLYGCQNFVDGGMELMSGMGDNIDDPSNAPALTSYVTIMVANCFVVFTAMFVF